MSSAIFAFDICYLCTLSTNCHLPLFGGDKTYHFVLLSGLRPCINIPLSKKPLRRLCENHQIFRSYSAYSNSSTTAYIAFLGAVLCSLTLDRLLKQLTYISRFRAGQIRNCCAHHGYRARWYTSRSRRFREDCF